MWPVVADRPSARDDDDDDGSTPPEVTAPPWLRTGPASDQAIVSPSTTGPSAVAQGGADPRESAGYVAPSRIRLGAGRAPEDPGAGAGRDPGGARHRADDLSTLPLGVPPAAPARWEAAYRSPAGTPVRGGRAHRIVLYAVAAVAVLAGSATLGFVITRGAVAPTGEQTAGCIAVSEPGRVVGDGAGSLDSPLGAVLAFDHAYYVERSAGKAFEAVSPSSRMTEQQLRVDGVGRVPVGTTHCVDARELAPTLLEVALTETAPDTEPVIIRQRIRVAENPDGTWGIVSITPAG